MVRRAFVLALTLLLAACGRSHQRTPFIDSRLPPGLPQADWPPAGWTWGLIRVGQDPPQRYGVAPAGDVTRAQVLILPGYGGLAEDEFAAASDFAGRGYTPWVLEGQGQGGSGRFVTPRDLGYARSLDGDVGAIRRMVQAVVRPAGGAPLTAIAYGTAAPEALRAAQEGWPGVSSLILTDPRFEPPGGAVYASLARWMQRQGLGAWRALGENPWRREADDADAVRRAWRTANPDLRMGAASYAWIVAFDDLVGEMNAGPWQDVDVPVLILQAGRADARTVRLCRRLPRCRIQAAPDLHVAEVAAVEARLRPASLFNPNPGR